ncbi:MAG: pyruvoyl-dependent arginine decarboxylase [Haloferacaceae archaeon]
MPLPLTVPLVDATGAGATSLDALDDALVAAGVGDYNLVEYSSILPAGATVERRDRLSGDRYPVGVPVGVVAARATATDAPVAAGIGWARADEGGVFFEASGADPAAVKREIRAGLAGARGRRDWAWRDDETVVVADRRSPVGGEGAAAAVVVAVHGRLD